MQSLLNNKLRNLDSQFVHLKRLADKSSTSTTIGSIFDCAPLLDSTKTCVRLQLQGEDSVRGWVWVVMGA